MRVLLVTPDYPPAVGGIQNLAGGIVKHRRDIEYTVLTFESPGSSAFDSAADYRVIRQPRYGHQQLDVAAINARTYCEASRGAFDAIASMHVVLAPGASATGLPWIQWVHAKEIPRRRRLASTFLPRSTLTVAVSRHAESLALAEGARANRTRVIPPGTDVGDSNACDPSCNREPETVLHVAQLNEAYKGTDVLMRAIPLLEGSVPNLKLVIVGDGKLRAQHELHARRLGVADRVHFLGRVSDEERDYWLRTASAFAMPSRLPADGGGEGFGIVFLEATAAGLPVVAGNVGGARDAVADGQTGVLVDPDSVEEVARGIRRCLVDTSLRRRVAESRYSWLRRFSWETITPRIEIAVGEAVLGGRRSELRFVRAGRLPR